MTNINDQGFTRLFAFVDQGSKDPSKLNEKIGKNELHHEAGIKARDTSKMHPAQKWFAKLFGAEVVWQGKTYLVGQRSLEAFVRRNENAFVHVYDKNHKLDIPKALQQVVNQAENKLINESRVAIKSKIQQKTARLEKTFSASSNTVSISPEELEGVFNVLGISSNKRESITQKLPQADGKNGQFTIAKKDFISVLKQHDHDVQVPEKLPAELKELGKAVVKFLKTNNRDEVDAVGAKLLTPSPATSKPAQEPSVMSKLQHPKRPDSPALLKAKHAAASALPGKVADSDKDTKSYAAVAKKPLEREKAAAAAAEKFQDVSKEVVALKGQFEKTALPQSIDDAKKELIKARNQIDSITKKFNDTGREYTQLEKSPKGVDAAKKSFAQLKGAYTALSTKLNKVIDNLEIANRTGGKKSYAEALTSKAPDVASKANRPIVMKDLAEQAAAKVKDKQMSDSGDTEEDVAVAAKPTITSKDVVSAIAIVASAAVPAEEKLEARFSRDLSETGESALAAHLTKRGQEIVVLRQAFDSPKLVGWTGEQKTHAKAWADDLISKGSKLGELTAKDLATMEHLYLSGLKMAMEGLSPKAKESLRDAINQVMPRIMKELGHEPLLAIEGPITRPAQEKQVRGKILETLNEFVRTAYGVENEKGQSVLENSLGKYRGMSSKENAWISDKLKLVNNEMEQSTERGWLRTTKGAPLGPNFLKDLISGDRDMDENTIEGRGIAGLILHGFEQAGVELPKKMDELVVKLRDLVDSYKELRTPVITTTMETLETAKSTVKTTKEERSTTKVTEHPGIIETETVKRTDRATVQREAVLEARNELINAFVDIEPLEGGYVTGPWDQIGSKPSQDMLTNLLGDSDSSFKQLQIDDPLLKDALDEGLRAAGYTTIEEMEEGEATNWPPEFRKAFVNYETKRLGLETHMKTQTEKLAAERPARALKRTRSEILQRPDKLTVKVEEPSEKRPDKAGLKSLRAEGYQKIRANKAEMNKKEGLEQKEYLASPEAVQDEMRAFIEMFKDTIEYKQLGSSIPFKAGSDQKILDSMLKKLAGNEQLTVNELVDMLKGTPASGDKRNPDGLRSLVKKAMERSGYATNADWPEVFKEWFQDIEKMSSNMIRQDAERMRAQKLADNSKNV